MRRIFQIGIWGALLALMGVALYLALTKAYAIDEFFYVHESWMMLHHHDFLARLAHGERVLPHVLFSPLVALSGDDPSRMIWLRGGMWGLWCVTVGSLSWVARRLFGAAREFQRGEQPGVGRERRALVLTTAVLATCTQPLVWSALEMRPDSVAIAMTSLALALLVEAPYRARSRWMSALSAVCLFLATCASVKALLYGAAFLPLAFIGLFPRQQRAFAHPIFFSLAFGACGLLLLLVILSHGSIEGYWEGLYGMAKHHEAHYTELSPWRIGRPLLRQNLLLWIGVLLGLFELGRAFFWRLWRAREVGAELLVVLLWVGGWLSFFMQKGAYEYSLIPGLAMSCVIASVGLYASVIRLWQLRERESWRTLAWVVLGSAVLCTHLYVTSFDYPTNEEQIAIQKQIATLTDADDVAYDMSATFVYRERAHEFAFLDNLRKQLYGGALLKEVPASIEEKGAVLFILDSRFWSFHKNSLGRYLQDNFIRYNDDLRFWGRRYAPNTRVKTATFKAIREDEYFIAPADWERYATLEIDGRPVTSQIVSLTKGEHPIRWTPKPGVTPPKAFYIVWLPANGEPFVPEAPSAPFSLGRHILPGGIRHDPTK